MQRRFLLSGLLAVLALSAAACADETPTLTGEEQFPPGSIPVTREITFPASEFIRTLGSFRGYSRGADLPFMVVANQFDEGLDAHALARFSGFPTLVTYRRENLERRDSLFTYAGSRLVMRVDTSATSEGPFTLQVWEAAQDWDRQTATWTTAIDTGSVQQPWTEPGGTRGALLGQATFNRTAAEGDSVVVTLTGAAVTALADSASRGVIVTTSSEGSRVELFEMVLRAAVKPDSALPDTTIFVTVATQGTRTTVYTPEQPDPGPGMLAAGGVLGARTLLEINADRRVPACAEGETCGTLPLDSVRLNQVQLLLRPAPVPAGFDPLTFVPLSMRLVDEPELGGDAPVGPRVLDVDPGRQSQVYFYAPGDTVVILPITTVARNEALSDSIPRTYMLMSEVAGNSVPSTFGVAFFQPEPRLRIIYTLPARRRLP
ncbi:MAG TPA: hypothetical protein VF142_18265 [Longimicrobium sp.]